MRLHTHLIVSALVGVARYPRRPWDALAVTLAGTLIDLDHLLLYAAHTGDWSVAGALRFDRYRHLRRVVGDSRPRYRSLRSWLHVPWLVLPPLWAVARTRPGLRPLALGVSLHLLLDHWDGPARLWVLARARGRCERCRRVGLRLVVFRARAAGRFRYLALCPTCATRQLAPPSAWPTVSGAARGAVVH